MTNGNSAGSMGDPRADVYAAFLEGRLDEDRATARLLALEAARRGLAKGTGRGELAESARELSGTRDD